MLVYVTSVTNRLHYTFDLILKDLVGIDYELTTDADTFSFGAVHGNLMAEPAFPQHQGSGLRLAAFIAAALARWCRHHHGVARVLEHDGARTIGRIDIVSAAENGVGVDVGGMGTTLGKHVHP